MKLVPFIADNANAALAQIHAELGPDAIVVSVRKLPANGIARLWQRAQDIEVLAGVPDEKGDPWRATSGMKTSGDEETQLPVTRRWRSVAWLESLGLLPEFADRLEQKVCAAHGNGPPPMPIAEWTAVRDVLAGFWRPARQVMEETRRPHVFVGPAGSGKTTVLCKWMTTTALPRKFSGVRVLRLDGEGANTSEFLSLHCEMLGVPVSRVWTKSEEAADLCFVDLPGAEIHDASALTALRVQMATLAEPHVHLVLNAAYETAVLFEQFRIFAALAPEDIIFTHLDEERHRVKLWNFVLGTNCSLSFLSAGQKIPGDFQRAEPALLFPREILR
ncbi:MAG TPA: hypothetical protein VMA35_14920 [Candidatus Sulfopaludibacter sp.]|nr:hypothetical protein [Candidatus Sulfopaludibacter sp.]